MMMINKGLVTVIVPIYNREKYLRKCLDSILGQTYQNIELICVDDGSTDESPQICDEYVQKDSRVKVLHIPNGGVSNARNTGLDNAQGEYIFFVDSDDYVKETHIQELLPQNGEEFVHGGFVSIKNGKEVNQYVPKPYLQTMEEICKKKKFVFEAELPSTVCMGCYKRTIIKEHNIRFASAALAEDQLFNLNYFAFCTTIRAVDKTTYCYEQTEHLSLMHKYAHESLSMGEAVSVEQEHLAKRPLYDMRWFNWKGVFAHYAKWKKKGTKTIKTDAKKQLKLAYKNTYFRECIPYIRKHGSLDERVETYFMGYYKHCLYKPVYGFIKMLSKIKNGGRK